VTRKAYIRVKPDGLTGSLRLRLPEPERPQGRGSGAGALEAQTERPPAGQPETRDSANPSSVGGTPSRPGTAQLERGIITGSGRRAAATQTGRVSRREPGLSSLSLWSTRIMIRDLRAIRALKPAVTNLNAGVTV
jgi:hypothetical protein